MNGPSRNHIATDTAGIKMKENPKEYAKLSGLKHWGKKIKKKEQKKTSGRIILMKYEIAVSVKKCSNSSKSGKTIISKKLSKFFVSNSKWALVKKGIEKMIMYFMVNVAL